MEQPGFLSPSMTKLECMLQSYFALRPELSEKILTPAELSQHISWMANSHNAGSGERFSPENIPAFIRSERHKALSKRFLENANDHQTLAALSKDSQLQREDCCVSANEDISTGRILRYLPACWHTTTCFQVYYAAEGTCRVHFANEIVQLEKGAVLIVAPGVLHATPCYCDDAVLAYFVIRSSTFDRVFWNQLPESWLLAGFFRQALSGKDGMAYLHFDTFADEEIARLMEKIGTEYGSCRPYRSQMLNLLTSTFFIALLRDYEGTARLPRTEDFYWNHEYSAIFSYIQSHFADTTISAVAERFHYSPKQIGRILRQCTGLSYSQLIVKLKMETAATLLQQGNLSSAAIAAAVGYCDVSSFYRAFTRYYRQTPVEYIQSHQA